MYRKILLAYDGSTEGRRALREGAALARHCNAEVFLLAVVDTSAGLRVAERPGATPSTGSAEGSSAAGISAAGASASSSTAFALSARQNAKRIALSRGRYCSTSTCPITLH